MGCGCKDKSVVKYADTKQVENNDKLTFKQILIGTALTAVLILLSPILLVGVWYLIITSVFGKNSNLIGLISKAYNKTYAVEVEEEEINLDDINPEEYELLDVDVIK